jgi:hypothetical protein
MKLIIYIVIAIFGCNSFNMNKVRDSLAEDKIVYKLVAKDVFRNSEPVKVQFILENKSDKSLFFLKWYTPFEGFNSDMFRITRNGAEIQYEGRMVKRGNPGFEDYLMIKAGSSVEISVELSLVYNMKESGEYRIEYRGKLYDYLFSDNSQEARKIIPTPPDNARMVDISGNSLVVNVSKY